MNFLLVFIGGGLGSCLRYGIGRLLSDATPAFPIATLLANLFACLVLGYGMSLVTQAKLSEAHQLLLLTGFCGGFSTFSTFSAEALSLWSNGQTFTAIAYIIVSLVIGIAAIWWLTK